jgi:RNA 2',3'-cyclic 3'-phosphodiesterase
MRLFLAVDLDASVARAAGAVVEECRSAMDARTPGASRLVKWVRPDQMHLTLHFLGEVDRALLVRLTQVMREPLPLAPFDLSVGGVGAFPAGTGPLRVVWLGCTQGARELTELHRLLTPRLAAVPVPVEDRPLSPHLTLGRFREPGSREWRTVLPMGPRGSVVTCTVSHVTLYESRLSSAGPAYTVVHRTFLQP